MIERGDYMIYQNLHLGDPSYLLVSKPLVSFPAHAHIEIELFYCTKGSYDIIINRKKYTVSSGELAIIGSMVSHEVLDNSNNLLSNCVFLEIGPTMLGKYFEPIKNQSFPNPIFDLKQEKYLTLYNLFNETATLCKNSSDFSSLLIKGNIYKISAHILKEFSSENSGTNTPKRLNFVNTIEKALDYIHNNYQEKLSIKEVAENCGYSKSNFCKIFKTITGDTFHNVLNNQRIKLACVLLKNSNYSIEDIACKVGFIDSKSFCRIFKKHNGISPGQYRRK